MRLIDKIAGHFGYVKAPIAPIVSPEPPPTPPAEQPIEERSTSRRPEPADFGLPDDVTFDVTRGGVTGTHPASWEEVVGFLEACEIDIFSLSGETTLAAIFAGVGIEIDGAVMSFRQRHPATN